MSRGGYRYEFRQPQYDFNHPEHARKNATAARVSLVVFGLSLGP